MVSVSRRALIGGALALGLAPRARAATGFSLRNARILLGDGGVVEGGLRVEDGLIVEVGAGVKSGEDLGGQVIFPGFWEGGSRLGLWEIDQEGASHDDQESSDAVMPQARVVDAYNPRSGAVPVARQEGVLGTLVHPSGPSVVSGQAAWMRTAGDTVPEATLLAPAGVCFHFGHGGTGATNGPKTRMGVAARMRDLLDAHAPPEPDKKKKKDEAKSPDTRLAKTVQALRRRELKAILFADRADDLLTALDFAREYQLDAVLSGCAEGHLVARALADAGHPCLVGPVTVQPDGWEHPAARYENLAVLHAAGVRLGARTGAGPAFLRQFRDELCIAVAHGLPWEAAILAGCAANPGFWGAKVGRIAVGHEASFVRADGDPLQPKTRMLAAWMRGQPLSLRSRQTELFERYQTLR